MNRLPPGHDVDPPMVSEFTDGLTRGLESGLLEKCLRPCGCRFEHALFTRGETLAWFTASVDTRVSDCLFGEKHV